MWAPKDHVYLINDLLHRPPFKKFEESWKIPSTGHPKRRTLAEFKEKYPDNFLQYADECRNPLIQIHAPGSKHRYPTNSISRGFREPFAPDPVSLPLNTFGIHLEPGCKNHGQLIHYTGLDLMEQLDMLWALAAQAMTSQVSRGLTDYTVSLSSLLVFLFLCFFLSSKK